MWTTHVGTGLGCWQWNGHSIKSALKAMFLTRSICFGLHLDMNCQERFLWISCDGPQAAKHSKHRTWVFFPSWAWVVLYWSCRVDQHPVGQSDLHGWVQQLSGTINQTICLLFKNGRHHLWTTFAPHNNAGQIRAEIKAGASAGKQIISDTITATWYKD